MGSLPEVTARLCVNRAEAVRCLGLYSMLPEAAQASTLGDSPMEAVAVSQRVAMLRTALVFDPEPAVQEAAAKALCDLALLRHAPCAPHPYNNGSAVSIPL